MAAFKRLTEAQLSRLGDDELVAYVAAAHDAGQVEASREAMGILAWGYQDMVVAKVVAKVPREDVPDVVMEVMASMLNSTFDGKVIGQFRAFLLKVTSRRIADFHRKREGNPDQLALDEEHEGDDGVHGAVVSSPDGTVDVEIRDLVEGVLATRNELHQRILRLYAPEVFGGEGLTAVETVERLAADGDAVSESNVQQVFHRFKTEVGALLDPSDDGDAPDG